MVLIIPLLLKNQELTWFSHRSIKNRNEQKKSENCPTLVWTFFFLMCMMAFSVSPSILLDVPHHASHCSIYIYIYSNLPQHASQCPNKKIILFFLFWHPSWCTHCPSRHQRHPSACFLTTLLPQKKCVWQHIYCERWCYHPWGCLLSRMKLGSCGYLLS
jgi:hypothetical protein